MLISVVVESAPKRASTPRSLSEVRGGGREVRFEMPDVTDRFKTEIPDVTWHSDYLSGFYLYTTLAKLLLLLIKRAILRPRIS